MLVAICHLILFLESSVVDIVCAVIPLSVNFPRQKKSGAQKGRGPEGWEAQNFALFFPPPATIFFHSSSLLGSFRGILVVFEAPEP